MTDWRKKYVDYTGELPTAESVSAYYDAVYMYKAAVEKAGSTDTKKVAQALTTIKYTGPSGKRDMKANHIADVEFMPFYQLGKVDEFEWLVPVRTEKIPYDQVKYTTAELIEHGCKWCKTI
jgi:ABC-type branched-subunit amino acid transport system substrate-binding protein